ncbi:hypothetical protein [Cellvibrio sp. KY-YJ-3]|uniref:hypothetical protein n=1 Tax=Cellvibrio sp. KY-YJ-3 TaxID=454662 RepID=UPI001246914B|nr:hypothetical protein [Cellvibrio sp. KY-YJ-3]QEY11817.1 hypothetical protein D0B88_05745 [Cellvibrio sp. KY-YJ-3]
MQDNIYAAPEANLVDTEAGAVNPAFYVVSPAKFFTLFFFTIGLFGVYWHYKNWTLYKVAYSDHEPMPVMRAIFSIFFTHALFSVIDMRVTDAGKDFKWNATAWATVGVIALVTSNVIDRIPASGTLGALFVFMPIPLTLVYGLTLLKAQRAINVSCNDPEGKSNRTITWANCIWIFLGAALFTLALLGVFLPEE